MVLLNKCRVGFVYPSGGRMSTQPLRVVRADPISHPSTGRTAVNSHAVSPAPTGCATAGRDAMPTRRCPQIGDHPMLTTPIPPGRLAPFAGVLVVAQDSFTESGNAAILTRLEGRYGEPTAALDYATHAIRNYHDSATAPSCGFHSHCSLCCWTGSRATKRPPPSSVLRSTPCPRRPFLSSIPDRSPTRGPRRRDLRVARPEG